MSVRKPLICSSSPVNAYSGWSSRSPRRSAAGRAVQSPASSLTCCVLSYTPGSPQRTAWPAGRRTSWHVLGGCGQAEPCPGRGAGSCELRRRDACPLPSLETPAALLPRQEPHSTMSESTTPHPDPGASLTDFPFELLDDDLGPGQRWSTWDDIGILAGPEPWPDWVITESAAIDTELGILKTGKEADVVLLERTARRTARSSSQPSATAAPSTGCSIATPAIPRAGPSVRAETAGPWPRGPAGGERSRPANGPGRVRLSRRPVVGRPPGALRCSWTTSRS